MDTVAVGQLLRLDFVSLLPAVGGHAEPEGEAAVDDAEVIASDSRVKKSVSNKRRL
jgi:hypothetical protein